MINHKTVFNRMLFYTTVLFTNSAIAEQRLDMEGTAIIGNKELPKVLYIVPWKSSEPVDLGKPTFNSVLDEPFQMLDRTAFQRNIEFYNNTYSLTDGKQ